MATAQNHHGVRIAIRLVMVVLQSGLNARDYRSEYYPTAAKPNRGSAPSF